MKCQDRLKFKVVAVEADLPSTSEGDLVSTDETKHTETDDEVGRCPGPSETGDTRRNPSPRGVTF